MGADADFRGGGRPHYCVNLAAREVRDSARFPAPDADRQMVSDRLATNALPQL